MSDSKAKKAVTEANRKPLAEPEVLDVISTNSTERDGSGLYKYDPKTVKNLIEAFNNSYSISEACQYARIDRKTYYNWLESVDGFREAMEEAKSMPLRLAKETITKAIVAGDVGTAKWYAERRDPDFKAKAEVDTNLGLQETRRKLGDLLDNDNRADDFGEQPTAATSPENRGEVPEHPTDIS